MPHCLSGVTCTNERDQLVKHAVTTGHKINTNEVRLISRKKRSIAKTRQKRRPVCL